MMFIRFSCNINVILTIVLLLFALAISNKYRPYLPTFLYHMIMLDMCKEAGLAAKVILMIAVTYFTFGYMTLVTFGNVLLYLMLKVVDKYVD